MTAKELIIKLMEFENLNKEIVFNPSDNRWDKKKIGKIIDHPYGNYIYLKEGE